MARAISVDPPRPPRGGFVVKEDDVEVGRAVIVGLEAAVAATQATAHLTHVPDIDLCQADDALERYWLAWLGNPIGSGGDKRVLRLEDTHSGALFEVTGFPAGYRAGSRDFTLSVECAFAVERPAP